MPSENQEEPQLANEPHFQFQYSQQLYQEYCKERDKLHDAALETGGRFDKALLTISTGALALSLVFVEKLAPTPAPYTVVALIVAWLLLLASVVFQLLALDASQRATNEQIRILDTQYEMSFKRGAPDHQDIRKQQENKAVESVTRYNTASLWSLVAGIVLVLGFSSINMII